MDFCTAKEMSFGTSAMRREMPFPKAAKLLAKPLPSQQ